MLLFSDFNYTSCTEKEKEIEKEAMNLLDISIKKRKSFDDIIQRELLDIFIKINSMKRKSLNKKCPLDLTRDLYGQNFLNYIFNL